MCRMGCNQSTAVQPMKPLPSVLEERGTTGRGVGWHCEDTNCLQEVLPERLMSSIILNQRGSAALELKERVKGAAARCRGRMRSLRSAIVLSFHGP